MQIAQSVSAANLGGGIQNVRGIIHRRRLCRVSLLFLDALSGILLFTCHLLSALIIMPTRRQEFASEAAEEAGSGVWRHAAVNAALHKKDII